MQLPRLLHSYLQYLSFASRGVSWLILSYYTRSRASTSPVSSLPTPATVPASSLLASGWDSSPHCSLSSSWPMGCTWLWVWRPWIALTILKDLLLLYPRLSDPPVPTQAHLAICHTWTSFCFLSISTSPLHLHSRLFFWASVHVYILCVIVCDCVCVWVCVVFCKSWWVVLYIHFTEI